ncbi:MAG TPA: 50S ribosomal protein L29 [Thermotogota bacterium]|nr:50S ribosomal protein L29 [Thermotogota bacterium]NLH20392.1 50S ribosomal protein L29 [Thermotogaceae bacterium]OQC31721.1 MAG: 50S ribosomal protein L29 [Thermotogota bacterium ADurb.Bin062]HNW46160.1 50S ribosomal protein L29 [Thermotogota bacterium]HNY81532.1 50S ribosomal protein L29 [Thermotogota bacterium]
MKAQEIRGLTDQELVQKMEALKKDLMNLRFQLALKQLDNTNKMKSVKRDIARIKTILTERELASQK